MSEKLSMIQLDRYIRTVASRIRLIPSDVLEFKADSFHWSKKEIFGHLIDSARNNLIRFLKVDSTEQPVKLDQYQQNELVKANRYQEQFLPDLIQLWVSTNRQILHVVSGYTDDQWTLLIDLSETPIEADFKFLFEDYVNHMQHHLKQIFGDLELQVAPFHVSFEDALEKLGDSDKPFITLLRDKKMYVEIYKPEVRDLQTPHDQDELYVIASGAGTFSIGNSTIEFSAGDVLFAPAGISHRFEKFSDDFVTWVIFY